MTGAVKARSGQNWETNADCPVFITTLSLFLYWIVLRPYGAQAGPPRTIRYRPIPGVSEQPRGPPGPPCEQRNRTVPAASEHAEHLHLGRGGLR